jgi:hypothetical protein
MADRIFAGRTTCGAPKGIETSIPAPPIFEVL